MACDCCGKESIRNIIEKSFISIKSFEYCSRCLQKGIEPYDAIVSYCMRSADNYDELSKCAKELVARNLKFYNKTLEEFNEDVRKKYLNLIGEQVQTSQNISKFVQETPIGAVYFQVDTETCEVKILNKLFFNHVYRHFKNKLYKVLTIAKHTETEEAMVVYQAWGGEHLTYARPLKMFLEEVPKDKDNPTGQTYRFELYSRR